MYFNFLLLLSALLRIRNICVYFSLSRNALMHIEWKRKKKKCTKPVVYRRAYHDARVCVCVCRAASTAIFAFLFFAFCFQYYSSFWRQFSIRYQRSNTPERPLSTAAHSTAQSTYNVHANCCYLFTAEQSEQSKHGRFKMKWKLNIQKNLHARRAFESRAVESRCAVFNFFFFRLVSRRYFIIFASEPSFWAAHFAYMCGINGIQITIIIIL